MVNAGILKQRMIEAGFPISRVSIGNRVASLDFEVGTTPQQKSDAQTWLKAFDWDAPDPDEVANKQERVALRQITDDDIDNANTTQLKTILKKFRRVLKRQLRSEI